MNEDAKEDAKAVNKEAESSDDTLKAAHQEKEEEGE